MFYLKFKHLIHGELYNQI